MRNTLLIFLVFFISVLNSHAEVSSDSASTSYLFGIHPFQLIVNGFKIEVERREAGSPYSLSVSPEFYYGKIYDAKDNIMLFANHDSIDVLGFGVNVSGRLYVAKLFDKATKVNYGRGNDQQTFSNFYMFGALEYRNFNLTYNGRGWVQIHENGIDVYKFSNIEQTNNVHRACMNIGIGNTFFFGDRFYFDFFVYSRFSKAFQSPGNSTVSTLEDGFFTLSGNSFALGFRFGLLFE